VRFLAVLNEEASAMKITSVIAIALLASGLAPAATLTVTTTADSGGGSLRQAILDSNASAGVLDTIAFAIGSGVQTITPLSALPTITDPVVIDGSTQPGYAGTPLIDIAGQGLAAQSLFLTAGGSTIRALVLRGFDATAIWIKTGGGNLVEGCYIGIDPSGAAADGNNVGILIDSSSGNTIGGSTPEARNVISGNAGLGISLSGAPLTVIAGNFVGTDAAGVSALGNGGGIFLAAHSDDCTIGGTSGTAPGGPCTGACNLVSGNNGDGINVTGSFAGNARVSVQGNFVGTDVTGTMPLGNHSYGIQAGGGSSEAVIGGTSPAARNVISGNFSDAVNLGSGGGAGHAVLGNFIGTNASGSAAIPNGGYGVHVSATPGMTIGGGAAGAGNLISGNTSGGIYLAGFLTFDNVVQGNRIGTDAAGTVALPNGADGIRIEGSDGNTIGGPSPGEGNVAAFHPSDGVSVSNATGNTIRGNSLFENGDLGIDLFTNGVTPNDPADGDTGANDLQNWPVLTSVEAAVPQGAATRFQGILHSTPSTTYDLDFYENPACPPFPREFLESQTYLGTGQVTTDAAGTGAFDVTLPVAVAAGARIAATATDPDGNTSELSQRIVLSLLPAAGPAGGGSNVSIFGTDFLNGASVTIGGQPATSVVTVGFTTITATTPALAIGSANDVVVTNPDGSTGTLVKGWVADFLDVPSGHQFHAFVTKLVSNAITAGIGGGLYGVDNNTLRQQMAVFLLKARHGLCYTPQGCAGVFGDVPCPSTFADWIEQLAAEGITGGCGGGNYCPQNPVRRDQMAVFLLKSEHGSGYLPPTCAGIFPDVPCPSPFADWIEQLAAEQITGGCGGGNYCPGSPNTRGQMAVFIVKTFVLD
jgi:parallel beta-helix repeat protein